MRRFSRLSFITSLALLVITLVASAQSGGAWRREPGLSIRRQETGAAEIAGKVYVLGGLLAEQPWRATETMEVFDIAAGQWSMGPPMPEPRDHIAVTILHGKLHAIGGYSGDFAGRDNHWIFDPVTNEWSIGAPLPEPRGAAWAVTFDDTIYVFGGTNHQKEIMPTTFIFDPAAQEWSRGADMPTAREHLNAVRVGDFIYVIGGRTEPATDVNERYDPATNTWMTMAPMPTPRSTMAVGVFGDRRIVCSGGTAGPGGGGGAIDLTEMYDTVTNTWTRQSPMPFPRHGLAAVVIDGERLFNPGGGQGGGRGPTDWVDSFRPGPTLMIDGACPGEVALHVIGATPGARVALVYARGVGETQVPPGRPCAGLHLWLDSTVELLRILNADDEGDASAAAEAPPAACGRVLTQAIDLESCLPSNIARLQ